MVIEICHDGGELEIGGAEYCAVVMAWEAETHGRTVLLQMNRAFTASVAAAMFGEDLKQVSVCFGWRSRGFRPWWQAGQRFRSELT